MEENLQQIYDGFAETYDANRSLFDMTEVFDAFYGRLGVEKGRLLDLGCGAGDSFAKRFTDRGWSVTGVDFSERMLALASRYVPEMERIHADMRRVEFEPNRFDAITAVYSLFHLPADDHLPLFRKFHRWLRPSGQALFTYATEQFTGSEEFDGHIEFLGQALYYSHKRPKALYADLESVGFRIEAKDYREIGNEVFLWVTVSKSS